MLNLFDIHEVKWEETKPGVRVCVFKPSPTMTFQYGELQPGCGAAPHSHPAEQLIYTQSGILEVTVEDQVYVVPTGCACLVPSNAVHSVINIGNATAVNIDFFTPSRDDRTESPKVIDFGHKGW